MKRTKDFVRYYYKALVIICLSIFSYSAQAQNQAQNYVIEMLVFAQKTAPNGQPQNESESALAQQQHQKLEQSLQLSQKVYGGSPLYYLSAAEQSLINNNFPVLFKQQWQVQNLSQTEEIAAAFSSPTRQIDGVMTLSGESVLKTDFMIRYRPSGQISTTSVPAHFIIQQQFLNLGNYYYLDNSKFGVIVTAQVN